MGDLKEQTSLFPGLDLSVPVSDSSEETKSTEAVRTLRRKYLVNKLNHLNFCREPVVFEFRQTEFDTVRLVSAIPQICKGENCDFEFIHEDGEDFDWINQYKVSNLRIIDEDTTVLIYPEEVIIGGSGISLALPKTALVLENDHESPEDAGNIDATIIQSGIRVRGSLISFSREELIVRSAEVEASRWFNSNADLMLLLERKGGLLFSEPCRISTISNDGGDRIFTLKVSRNQIQRFPSRQFRSQRSELQTSPRCQFVHPLSGRVLERRLTDMSGTGFSFKDEHRSAILPVGLILDEVTLHFAEYSSVKVRAQVIHCSRNEVGKKFSYGLCILNIDPRDHLILLSLVHQAHNTYATLCKKVDLDSLWRFFFESGFIYPEKYTFLQQNRDQIRRSFELLYQDRNNVARHFIYQREDKIQGHLSMVRFYERTWLLHHHASSVEKSENAGVHVLHQAGSYLNDTSRFTRMNIDYLMCFYRRKNRFPHRVFGGLIDYVDNKRICSGDEMAYCTLSSSDEDLSHDALWSLEASDREDMIHLNEFYSRVSGGLLLEAMHLPPFAGIESTNAGVTAAYKELGITRNVQLRSLKHNNRLTAVFVINCSDPGINLSELTNSILMFVIKPELISRDIVRKALASAAADGANSASPVLVFPQDSADKMNVDYEKSYVAWIMDIAIGDTYFEHIQSVLHKVQS